MYIKVNMLTSDYHMFSFWYILNVIRVDSFDTTHICRLTRLEPQNLHSNLRYIDRFVKKPTYFKGQSFTHMPSILWCYYSCYSATHIWVKQYFLQCMYLLIYLCVDSKQLYIWLFFDSWDICLCLRIEIIFIVQFMSTEHIQPSLWFQQT